MTVAPAGWDPDRDLSRTFTEDKLDAGLPPDSPLPEGEFPAIPDQNGQGV